MTTDYLFVFGFEDPSDRKSNSGAGTDFETTGCFRINTESAEDAIQWGRILARWFVNKLFNKPGEHWSSESFANWIEDQPDKELAEFARHLPLLSEGEYPEFEDIRALFKC